MPPRPSRSSKPSFKKDRVAWNKAWELEIAFTYGTDQTITMSPIRLKRFGKRLLDRPPPSMFEGIMNDASLHDFHAAYRQILLWQRDLSRKVVQRYTVSDFEAKWRECGPKERTKWILEGLVRTCEAGYIDEWYRGQCPETTIARLNYQSGQGFLDLVAQLVGKDAEEVADEVRSVPNPVWDALNSSEKKNLSPGQRIAQRSNNANRAGFLTFFCWNVFLAFYGETRETYCLKLKDKAVPNEQLKATLRDAAPKKMMEELKQQEKWRKEAYRAAFRACSVCNRRPEDLGIPNLLACQKCKGIERYVYYCSRECQVNDWKHGRPPHKTICGNTSALADSILGNTPPTDNPNSKWGKPDPGFTRSLSLLYQLSCLHQAPHYDYFLVRAEPEFTSDSVVLFPNSELKQRFLDNLRVAVCRYAPKEVEAMYRMLVPFAAYAPGVGVDRLKKQLKNEYGVDVDEVQLESAVADLSCLD